MFVVVMVVVEGLFCKISLHRLVFYQITQVSLVSEGNPGCTVLLGAMLVGGGGDGRWWWW